MRINGVLEARHNSNGSNLKVLIERRCLAPLTLNDDVSRYQKLPQLQHLKLSVLKLDGSVFEVQVVKSATVAELKSAIEEFFSSLPKEGQDKISWSLVWGHFCLCYEGQKLINDKSNIRNYGIKEGDQLQFIRHMSINYSPFKKRPKKENTSCKKDLLMLSSGSNACEESEQNGMNVGKESKEIDKEEENGAAQFKMAHFLRGLLSYSKLRGFSRGGGSSDCRTSRPTRFALQFLRT
ncbi:hypothetical protein L484_025757 [Morus notabilis]|uniref:Ubiquitin-like domain-containing protein n=1 Tax=Morus notabilis TaxID=981085 RepID=W9REE9_9ROSA|nr:hypothetical protein L484_025757 [Morus notabilis]